MCPSTAEEWLNYRAAKTLPRLPHLQKDRESRLQINKSVDRALLFAGHKAMNCACSPSLHSASGESVVTSGQVDSSGTSGKLKIPCCSQTNP
jgi:hypothetical protein